MVFDRKAKLDDGTDLVGVGHPLITRALRQAQNFVGAVAVVKGLAKPVVVFHISDRVTDGGAHVQETLVGMAAHQGEFELLKDWQLLSLLNDLSTTDCSGKIPDTTAAVNLLQQAKLAVNQNLPGLDLPFSVPDVHELILLWPDKLAV